MATIFRDGNVARRCSAGVDLSNLGQFAIGTDGIGKDLSVVLNVFRAGVDNVELWMKAREGWVDDIVGVSFDVQKDHRSVRWMESEYLDGMLSFGATGTVGESALVLVYKWLLMRM